MKKEETIIVKGSIFVDNFKDVPVSDLEKINEIKDRFGNQVFKINTDNGEITMVKEIQKAVNAYKNLFVDPFYRLIVVINPVRREWIRHDSTYNNRLPTPEVSTRLNLNGVFYVTIEGQKNYENLPFRFINSEHENTKEDEKIWKNTVTKTEKNLKIFLMILFSPILIPGTLIMFPMFKLVDVIENKRLKKSEQKCGMTLSGTPL